MIRVLVAGAAGKMGHEVVKAVTAADGMEVVSAVDISHAGEELDDGAGGRLTVEGDLADALGAHEPHVMVDFTHPSAVEGNLRAALPAGVDCVVGTTGLSNQKLTELATLAPSGTCLFVAPNFAIGAVLLMEFAERAAKFMPHVEIIELHHDRKADAPSGTALRTAALIEAVRPDAPPTPGAETELPIARGARGACVGGTRIHSVRLPGLVAHQEVLFGGQGQTLSIRHDSIDRTSFMPGVVHAIRAVVSREGLVVGLESVLEEWA